MMDYNDLEYDILKSTTGTLYILPSLFEGEGAGVGELQRALLLRVQVRLFLAP